ncbi:MAG TPA: ATP-dependent acyl-CoA ligase [Beijerinckiaceae bacterium]|nr:ATP-dependent acyl-CoA ligase [Beijerinckiaceae bacterium]
MMLPGFPWLPLPPEERTLARMLVGQAERYGSRRLFSCLGETWRFDEAPGIAAHMAGALAEAGIQAGDRVAILSPNRPEVMRLLVGCGWLGAVAVPLNTAVKTRQLRYYLENSGARLLVIDPQLLAALEPGAFDGLALDRIWVPGGDAPTPGAEPFRAEGPAVPAHASSPGDPFAILYTSGTTGAPKGVVCPQAQFHWWGLLTARFLELREGDVLATPLPLFHTNAINTFFQALLTGSTLEVLPKFSASGFWRAMSESGATVSYLLGAMVPMLLAQPESDLERAHRLRVALGPGVPAAMHERLFERTGVRLVDGFGSTETNFIIGGTAGERVPGRMGRVAPGIAARVVDGLDEPVPDGTAGELVVRSDEPFSFASGYFGLPEKTVEAWRNLWFHTGDRVIRHGDGTFAFIDRLKDVIRRRGENISSFEVEQVIAAFAEVETVAVFPVPSDLAEDEVMAALVLKPGAALDAADFFARCARELPRHAVPRYVEVFAELPRTENGKVQKFKLRERGLTPATLDRMA